MEYNKKKFDKVRDKKVLHKVKKQWIVLSMALLAAFGAKALSTHAVHADVNNNRVSNTQNINVKSQSNPQLINSQSNRNQVASNAGASLSNDQIMHRASVLNRKIVNNAMTSSNASQSSAPVQRQLSVTKSNLSVSVPQSDEGSVNFQYKDQNGRTVGKTASVPGQVGNHINLSDVTNYHGPLPVPNGYHLMNYYNNSNPTPYSFKKQPDTWIIHIQGNSVSPSPIKVYLHIENSDVGSDVKTISDYTPKGSTNGSLLIGDVIAEPNQFLNNKAYSSYFDNHPSDYHLDNNDGRDRDVLAQLDANGQFLPKRIDFYYVHKSQAVPDKYARIKTYYYDRQNYDPSKGFTWNNQHSLVPDSVIPELSQANGPFNHQSRQDNVPAGYYFVKNLGSVPTHFGASKTTGYYDIEVAKNAKLVYQVPSDNDRVVDQSDVKGFNMNGEHDAISQYLKPQTGFWESGVYATPKGTQPVNTISNGQTYYVNLSRQVPVTINYVDNSQPNRVIYSTSVNFRVDQPQKFDNSGAVQKQIPNWHLQNSTDADATYVVDTPQTIKVPVYTDVTGHVILHDVSDGQDLPLSDNQGTITGKPGMPINYQKYIKYVPSGYHLNANDQAKDANWKLLSDNDYTINVDRDQGQGQINVNYVTNDNTNKVLTTIHANDYVGSKFNLAPYTNSSYISRILANYHLDHVINNHVTNYGKKSQNIYIDVTPNSKPSTDVSVELKYFDPQDNTVEKYLTISGQKGAPIDYSQYTTANYIPQGYTYAGLGSHANNFEDGAQADILIDKSHVTPKPQEASVQLNYVDRSDGSIKQQLDVTGPVGTPISYNQYTNVNSLPQGYTYAGLGNHPINFEDGAQATILVNKQAVQPHPVPTPTPASNPQPVQPASTPQEASVQLNYVDQSDGSIKRQTNIMGLTGTPISYDQYTVANKLPQGYSYVGLGNHSNTFQNGSTDDILIRKNSVSHSEPRRNTPPAASHRKSSIDVVYEDPQGHVIKKRVYKGTAGETFNTGKSRALPGYRFRKVVLGDRTDKFGKHRQLIIMQMLPLSHIRTAHRRDRNSNVPAYESSQFDDYKAEDGHNGYDADMELGAASRLNDDSNAVSNQNNGNSGSQSNGKLPQTGEAQSGDVQVLLGMILLMSAVLIAGYDFDLKRRN